MSQFSVSKLLDSEIVLVRDVVCSGECRHRSGEECAHATHLVFPYRGIFVRHVGRDDAVAESNQVLFFNPHEGYQVSHPVAGGDACLDLRLSQDILDELAPAELLRKGAASFLMQRRRIDPRAQVLVALLRHSLQRGISEPLEAETLALTLVRRALGERTSHTAGASAGRRKLVDRAKVVMASDLTQH